jgi:hypothetical protein
MKDPASVDAALAGSALAVSALDGDAALYDKYVEHLNTAKTPEEYYNYFGALGQFANPALAKRTFELMLSPAVKSQDLFYLIGSFANYETQAAAWELLKTGFQAILAKAGPGLGTGFPGLARFFCDEKLRDDSQQFFAAQNLPGSERPLKNAKDTVNACIELRSLQQSRLSEYLKKSSATDGAIETH